MNVYLQEENVQNHQIQIRMSRNDVQMLNKSDNININSVNYKIKEKIFYFSDDSFGNLSIDYSTLIVKRLDN